MHGPRGPYQVYTQSITSASMKHLIFNAITFIHPESIYVASKCNKLRALGHLDGFKTIRRARFAASSLLERQSTTKICTAQEPEMYEEILHNHLSRWSLMQLMCSVENICPSHQTQWHLRSSFMRTLTDAVRKKIYRISKIVMESCWPSLPRRNHGTAAPHTGCLRQ